MYQKLDDGVILKLDSMWFIPQDLANRDYQDYLAWLDEQDEP